jgi:hypothetical protein
MPPLQFSLASLFVAITFVATVCGGLLGWGDIPPVFKLLLLGNLAAIMLYAAAFLYLTVADSLSKDR